ncbi:MAG: hypothetical protein JWL84_586, partial [Rhodospirillales bacterium]|nr:hypothetical protein [Rhodospirillales bacterium]
MSSNIAVEISANVGQLTAGLSLAQQNLKDTTSAVSALSKEMLNAGTTASDSLKGRFVEAAQALASARAEVTSMKSALAEASSAAHDGASANDNLKFATAGATREFIVLGHEAMSGNFSRIPGSLMVLAERMGGLHSVSLGLVAAVAAVGIGIYELGRYAYSAYEEVNKLQGTLLVLGRGQDFDAAKSRIDAMRGSLGTSRKDAMTVADAIEGIPIATDEARAAMERYAVLASAASRGNVDVGKTSEQIAAAAMTGAAGVERLGERWGLVFTPAQREALDQAKAANDVIQAQDVLVQALSARFEPAAAHVKGLVEQFTALAMASAGGAEGGMVQVPRVPKLETGPAVTIGDDQVASALKLSNALNPAARDAEDLRAKIGTLNAGLKALGDEADPAIRGKMAGAIDEAQRKLDTLQLGPVMARAKAEIASMQANWSGSEEGMLARSQAIWTSYLGQVRQGSAQYVEIQASADRTTTALHKLEATEHMRALEAATSAARAGSAERVAAAQAEVTFATSHYGAGSTQAIQAEKAMTAAKREESDARRNISIKEIDDQIKDLDRRLSADQKHNDQLVKQGKLSADDRAHAEIDTANTVYAMELELADRQIALLDKQTPAYQAAADRRKAIEQKLSDDLSRIDDQRATAQAAKNNTDAQAWSKSFQPVSSAFDTMTRGMLSGRQTLAQVMLSTASSFVTSELAADAKMLFSKLALYTAEKAGFITGESAKLLATKTTEGGMLTTLLFHSA